MGFKVIETEEELRSAHSAGLLWYKIAHQTEYTKEYLPLSTLLEDWKKRATWESYILVEDE